MAVTEDDLAAMLTRQQAAEFIGVSIETVDRMIRDGELEAHKIRSRVRISPSACVAAVNRRSTILAPRRRAGRPRKTA